MRRLFLFPILAGFLPSGRGSPGPGWALGFILLVIVLWVGSVFLQATSRAAGEKTPVPVDGYEIVRVYPHDPGAYTQGLVFKDGYLYESTGRYGRSSLRRVNLETGRNINLTPLPPYYFGEGLTDWEDQWIQLTWQSRVALIYDGSSLGLIKKVPYPLEGWGLTRDDRSLIASDGSAHLYFLDPKRLTVTRRVVVRDQGRPVIRLNELERVRGEVLANVYLTDRIARIAPETGAVTGWIDLRGLLPAADRRAETDVLNGIAYDARQDRLFVTGKNWPKLFEIRIVKRP